jgi:hypothetical protein
MAGDIISECRAASNRNAGRHHPGIVGGIRRNPQPDRLQQTSFGRKSAEKVICDTVLELTYTANDLSPFARDLGYIDKKGVVRPPFHWDEERRLVLRAKLDAIFFHLYGVTDREDIRYIYSTFPIWEREQLATYDRYRSRDLCLAWLNALAAGNPDAEIVL